MKKLLYIMFSIFMIFMFGGCEKSNEEIKNFTYEYGNLFNGYYKYNITNDNNIHFTASENNDDELNIDKNITSTDLQTLSEVIKNNNINEWNGFDKSITSVIDGYSFYLEVNYTNGKSIKAHGSMEYPENYSEGHEALVKFFNSIK